ncbi:hypothetical protein DM02DRAFT_61822 [Periconia macrospinosa]|uniref:Uncharacterized protein n=1 Tax=Periconia macrospinosa TaxID=97972 RepID=A0A2V1DJ95_9PLEO|nr:hypothetical protein DM02DRAFT_61822 [Periconia macrospinosa]
MADMVEMRLSSCDSQPSQADIESAPTYHIPHGHCSKDDCGMHEEHLSILYIKEGPALKETPIFTAPYNMPRKELELPYEESDGSFYGGCRSPEHYKYDVDFVTLFQQSCPSQNPRQIQEGGDDHWFHDSEWEGLAEFDWLAHRRDAGLRTTINADSEAGEQPMGYHVGVYDGNMRLITDEKYLLSDVLTEDGRDVGLVAERTALDARAPAPGAGLREQEDLNTDAGLMDHEWEMRAPEEPGPTRDPFDSSDPDTPAWQQLDISTEPPPPFDRKPEPTLLSGILHSGNVLQSQVLRNTGSESLVSVVPEVQQATFSNFTFNSTFQQPGDVIPVSTGRYLELPKGDRDRIAAETFGSPYHRLVQRAGYYDTLRDSTGQSDAAVSSEGTAARPGINPAGEELRSVPPVQRKSTIEEQFRSILASSSEENTPSPEAKHQDSAVIKEPRQILALPPANTNPASESVVNEEPKEASASPPASTNAPPAQFQDSAVNEEPRQVSTLPPANTNPVPESVLNEEPKEASVLPPVSADTPPAQFQNSAVNEQPQQAPPLPPTSPKAPPTPLQPNATSNKTGKMPASADTKAPLFLSGQASAQFSANYNEYQERLASLARESYNVGSIPKNTDKSLLAQLAEAADPDGSMQGPSHTDSQIRTGEMLAESENLKGVVRKKTARGEDNEAAFKPDDLPSSSDDQAPTPKRQKNNSGVKTKSFTKRKDKGKGKVVDLEDVVMEDIGEGQDADQLDKGKARATIDTVPENTDDMNKQSTAVSEDRVNVSTASLPSSPSTLAGTETAAKGRGLGQHPGNAASPPALPKIFLRSVEYIEQVGHRDASNAPSKGPVTPLSQKSSAKVHPIDSNQPMQEVIVDTDGRGISAENDHYRKGLVDTFLKDSSSSLSSVPENDSPEAPTPTKVSKSESIAPAKPSAKPSPKLTRSKAKPEVAAAAAWLTANAKSKRAAPATPSKPSSSKKGGIKSEGGTEPKGKKGNGTTKNATNANTFKTKKPPPNNKDPAGVLLPGQDMRETRRASLARQELEETTARDKNIGKRLRSKNPRK